MSLLKFVVGLVLFFTLANAGPCDYKALPYLGGDGFALVPGPNGLFFNTFHHISPAYINFLDYVDGNIVHQNIDMSPPGLTTSVGNNLHGIQVVQNRYYLYPVSLISSGVIYGWGVGCFDIANLEVCAANGGYTGMSLNSASAGSASYTGIYGLVPNGTWLFSVDQDNVLYCFDSINLGACSGWNPISLTTANFPSTTPTADSQYSIDMLPGTSRLYIIKNTGSSTYIRCIDLTRWGVYSDLSCAGFAQPSNIDLSYSRGAYAYEIHFRQVFPSGNWLTCTNTIDGPCGCVDAYSGATTVDYNTAGTYNGVPAALYSLGQQINSAWTPSGGFTGKYRVGNRTYFSGLNRNGVICWDDSTNAFCLNSTGQSFSHNSSYPGLLYSGAETEDYEVTYDPLSGCFFSMGNTATPWNFDADGNVPCQASGVYTTLLVADYAEIPVSGTANLNVTANDLPSGNINQASVTVVSPPPSNSYTSFSSAADSYGNIIFTFVPKSGYCGNATFTYSACSNANFPKVSQTTATVHVNCPPTAVAETFYFYPNTPTLVLATANDTDPDLPNDHITMYSVGSPSHGTTVISDNSLAVTYTPSTNSYATDSFTYIVQDKFSQQSGSATITAIPIIPSISIKNNGGTTVSNGGSQTFTSNVGSTTTTTDTITNSGTSPLTITGITLPNGYTTTLSTPITVQPGQTVNLPISYDPNEGGDSSGTITIYSNDPQNPVFTINTQNDAVGPSITVSANSNYLNNGQTLTLSGAPGSTINQNVVVGNNGTAALSITSNPVSGSGYSVSGGSTSVAASGSTTFTVSLVETNPGSYPGSITFHSTDGINPSFVVYFTASVVGPQIVLSENGQTITNGGSASTSGTTGTPINQTITITNNGNQNLDITGVSTSGSGYTVVSGPPSGTVLAPGQSTTVVVQYSGSGTTGTYNGGLTVTSNDTVNPTYTTTVSTTVESSSVSVTNNGNPISNGGTVTFPEAPVNSSSSQNIVFTNNGDSPLTITGVNIPPGYYVSGGNVSTSGTTVVQPGQTVVLTVSQNTSSPGDNNGTISFNTNDPNNPNYSIQVNGATGQGTISISGSGSSGSNSAFGNGKSGLSLPPIQQGSINTTAFTITNSNPSQSLVIYPTSVFPSGFYPVTSIPSSGLVIPAGSSLTFTVGINTNNPGLINQTILFQNSDPNNATFAVTTSVFIYYWNFTAPAAPNGTTTWKMYANSTISWITNIGTHTVNLYLVTTSSGSLKTLTTAHSGSTPFYYSPSGLTLGSYYIRATLIDSTPGFTTLNGKIVYSSTFNLAYS